MPEEARLLDHDTLDVLRGRHPAWRLLRAEHAPLILSFLHRVFVLPNARAIAQPELTSRLDDYLFELRERLGEGVYPRSAVEYLDAWASDDAGYLRKYYPAAGGDEPSFDLTPAAEKAIEWVTSLGRRPFVATESRLLTVFDLLRQIVEGTEQDRDARLADLRGRRDQIDGEIQRLEAGDFTLMDAAGVKDQRRHPLEDAVDVLETKERRLALRWWGTCGVVETAVVNVFVVLVACVSLRAGAGGCARLSASARTTAADDLGYGAPSSPVATGLRGTLELDDLARRSTLRGSHLRDLMHALV